MPTAISCRSSSTWAWRRSDASAGGRAGPGDSLSVVSSGARPQVLFKAIGAGAGRAGRISVLRRAEPESGATVKPKERIHEPFRESRRRRAAHPVPAGGDGGGAGETVWTHDQPAFTMSLVATGGGLVFGGDADGRFKALDHETGEVLWEINLGSPVTGFPVTYAAGGRQYVAVSTGRSLNTSGLRRLTPDLRPSDGNTLFVFALP